MKFDIFSKLYNEAREYTDVEMYIAERGWQGWMEDYENGSDATDIADILFYIYDLAHMGIKEMRSYMKLTFRAFSAIYSIPSRTVQDWEYGKSKTPEYMLKLVAYTIFTGRGRTDEQD